LQALAALHGFWFMAIIPPVFVARRRLSARRLITVGLAAMFLALCGFLAIAVYEKLTWNIHTPVLRQYLLRRILFAIGTMTDLPLIQLFVAGMICWLAGRRLALQSPLVQIGDQQ
jgi:hypothetical protein